MTPWEKVSVKKWMGKGKSCQYDFSLPPLGETYQLPRQYIHPDLVRKYMHVEPLGNPHVFQCLCGAMNMAPELGFNNDLECDVTKPWQYIRECHHCGDWHYVTNI